MKEKEVFKIVAACREVIKHANRMSMTAPVDDDFPQVKYEFDSAVVNYASLIRPTAEPTSGDWNEALEAAAKECESDMTCGCGRSDCLIDRPAESLARRIRSMKRPTGAGK